MILVLLPYTDHVDFSHRQGTQAPILEILWTRMPEFLANPRLLHLHNRAAFYSRTEQTDRPHLHHSYQLEPLLLTSARLGNIQRKDEWLNWRPHFSLV